MKVYEPKELAKVAGNKYLGVLVASKYARELNSLPLQRSPYQGTKLTTLALQALTSGEVDFRLAEKRRRKRSG